uniref:Xpo1 domain-containing protein n=1 Tax=Rhabditophanes sp. KR3021 TaxID=114890 RepID=A0AC35TUR5_9BILA
MFNGQEMSEENKLQYCVSTVNEFYSCTNPDRRVVLNDILTNLKHDISFLKCAFQCLRPETSHTIQLFGASMVYTMIQEHFEAIAGEATFIRDFLMNILYTMHDRIPYAVFNKLSSCLALFMLSTMPDIWANPIQELTVSWADKSDLCLKVLSEMATLFHKLKVPLSQRSIIKTALHDNSTNIISILQTILCSPDVNPVTSQAAIECVESWMKLPGLTLANFEHVLLLILEARADDYRVIDKIMNAMMDNKEVKKNPELILKVLSFIYAKILPSTMNFLKSYNYAAASTDDVETDFEDINSMISALTDFMSEVINSLTQNVAICTRALPTICGMSDFFLQISNFPQPYPIKENFSDIPQDYWAALRESLPEDKAFDENFIQYFANNLRGCIHKIAYSTNPNLYNKTEFEKLENYRVRRCEDSLNVYDKAPSEALAFLTQSLEESYRDKNINVAESVLYLLDNIADYLSDAEYSTVVKFINLTLAFTKANAFESLPTYDLVKVKFCENILSILTKFSYLLLTCDDKGLMLTNSIDIAYYFMTASKATVTDAINYILKIVEAQTSLLLPMADTLIPICYKFFENEELEQSDRINSMKIVGNLLAIKPLEEVLSNMNTLVLPRMEFIHQVVTNEKELSHEVSEQVQAKILFELAVLGAIVKSIQKRSSTRAEADIISKDGLTVVNSDGKEKGLVTIQELEATSPVYMILKQFSGDVIILINRFSHNDALMKDMMKVLEAALNVLKYNIFYFADLYLNVIGTLIYKNTPVAVELGKAFMVYIAKDNEMFSVLIDHVQAWYSGVLIDGFQFVREDDPVEMVDLAFRILRRGSSLIIRGHPENQIGVFLRSVGVICTKLLGSENMNAKREAGSTLKLWVRAVRDIPGMSPIRDFLPEILPGMLDTFLANISNPCIQQNVLDAISECMCTLVTDCSDITNAYYISRYPEDSEHFDGIYKQLFLRPGSTKNYQIKINIINRQCRRNNTTN